jgi:hypothetical protein
MSLFSYKKYIRRNGVTDWAAVKWGGQTVRFSGSLAPVPYYHDNWLKVADMWLVHSPDLRGSALCGAIVKNCPGM